jgi:hypothetical protein
MAKWHLVCVCLALGGCDYVFRIDRINSDASAPPHDGALACVGAVIDDSFDDGSTCAPWGGPYENTGAQLREGRSGLTVTPASIGTSSAGCTSTEALPFRDGGISVEVSSVLTGEGGEYTQLQIFEEVNATIGVVSEKLIVFDADADDTVHSVDYDPVAMRWWRLRPSTATSQVIAETSPDGETWTPEIAMPRAALAPAARINLIAGVGDTQITFADVSTFRRLIVCP